MIRKIAAVAAVAALAAFGLLSHPPVTNSPRGGHFVTIAFDSPRPPANPVCKPLVATIRHWLRVLDHTPVPSPLWKQAAIAVDDCVNPDLGQFNRWIFEVGNSFYGDGLGYDFTRPLRDGLRHIRVSCPGLPASITSGPLPR
jgi:hypothetical protein